MVRTICLVLIGLFLFSIAPLNAEPPSDPGAVEITLGWAQPDFDDSKWETVDLAPETKATDPGSGYLPAWTAGGHAGYWGWAWYRLRLKVSAKPGDRMAIDVPIAADDAWQFFVGAQLLGKFGDFDSRGNVRRINDPRPLMIPLLPVQKQRKRRGH
jgi:hypothetical protein